MILGICHSPSLGSAFLRVSFILKIVKGYVLQISFTTSAESEHLFPDSSSKSPGLVSHGSKLGQVWKPSSVTLIAQTCTRSFSLESGEGKSLVVLFV